MALIVVFVILWEMIPSRAFAASSWNPTLLVNTESFQQIDRGDGSTTVDLQFGANTSTLKLLTNSTFQFNRSLSVVGGISGSYLTIDHQANISGALLVKRTITSRSTVSGANLTFMGATASYILGSLGIGKSATPNTKLEVLGTISGSRLGIYNTGNVTATGALYVGQYAAATGAMIRNFNAVTRPVLALDSTGKTGLSSHLIFGYQGSFDTTLFRSAAATLRTNGSFIVRDTLSGTILNANSLLTGSTIQGFGLYDCQGTSKKLTYNATTKKLLCEADQTGGAGASNWSNTGSLRIAFDDRYVNQHGDTMTGNLIIRSTSGTNVPNLSVFGGMSGYFLRASGNADINGVLALSGVTIRRTISDPVAAAANRLATYAADLGGRALLKGRAAVGTAYAYQPALFQNFVMMLQAGGGTTINGIGTTVTSDTTISHPAVTETFGYMANFATAASTNDTAGTSSANTTFVRGSAAGANGFFYRARIGVVDTTSIRVFSGLANQTIATMVGADNPAGHYVGFQFSTNRPDTNWQFTTKDNTTQSVANTTIAFTANKVYDLTFFCSSQCASITWRIDNVTDGTSATGTASSNLPGTTTALRIVEGVSTLTTVVKNLRMQFAYTEADR